MKTLESISQKLKLRKERLEEASRKIIKQLEEIGAIKIILFGSFVSGKISSHS